MGNSPLAFTLVDDRDYAFSMRLCLMPLKAASNDC